MVPTIREENPQQVEIARLLAESDAIAARLYPGEYRRPLNPRTLTAPGIHFSWHASRVQLPAAARFSINATARPS